jgi:outer membrane protein assembly factor BamE (lipoprotein component of BamABCDE complex)
MGAAVRRDPPPFTLGSTKAEVEAAQGSPSSIDKTYGETWSYGTASVEFRNGRVFAWLNSPFVKLNVELEPKDNAKASVARTRGNFTLGSTKDEVLAVHGTPDGIDRTYGETWSYGTSTIQFADGKVHSWRSSPVGVALKAHLAPRSTPAADAAAERGSYGPTATKDEVLAVEGTPTSIDKTYGETWSYGTSTIRFSNGRIAEYRNSPVGPTLKIEAKRSDSDKATLDGFMKRVIKAMDQVADDVCRCATLACAQQVASSTRDRGFRAGYAYTRDRDATPELTKFIATMLDDTGTAFTDYVKQNHAAWFGRFKARLESCVARLKGEAAGTSKNAATNRVDQRPTRPTFKLGDSSHRVLAAQGKPDNVVNNSATRETWIYGSASVMIEEGKVVDYRNSGGVLRIE